MKRFIVLFFVLITSISIPAYTQHEAATIKPEARAATIDEVSRLIQERYVYPEMAAKMVEHIRARQKAGAYDQLNEASAFADAVMKDLVSISKDGHLFFHYSPQENAGIKKLATLTEEEKTKILTQEAERGRRDDFGFRKVERLEGNIGYLAFDYFAPAAVAGETASAALNFLSGVDALIVDLRQNGGGEPTLIQFMTSYFFESPVHLNDIYTRKTNHTENFWTFPYVPGRKLSKADIYVLTSGTTFSGAEEFSYNLKNLKRATIVGETTGGGAHPDETEAVGDLFTIGVPFGRAINPITKTNWEGAGVSPDVDVAAAKAFDVAYRMAVEKLAGRAGKEESKAELEWILVGLRSRENPVKLDQQAAAKYAGVYGGRTVTLENGTLFYQRSGPKYKMIPMSETLFQIEGLDYFRLEMVVKDNKAVEVIGVYRDGRREPSKRSA